MAREKRTEIPVERVREVLKKEDQYRRSNLIETASDPVRTEEFCQGVLSRYKTMQRTLQYVADALSVEVAFMDYDHAFAEARKIAREKREERE